MFQKNSRTIPVQIEDLTFCGHSTSNKTPEFFCCKKSAMSSVQTGNLLPLLLPKQTWEQSSSQKRFCNFAVSIFSGTSLVRTRNLMTFLFRKKIGMNSVQRRAILSPYSVTTNLERIQFKQTSYDFLARVHCKQEILQPYCFTKKSWKNLVHRRNLITLLFQFFAGDESEAGTSSVQTGKLMALLFPKKI